MHVHILGIGGTFMAGVAMLARAAGHRVTGSDANVYPPMSTQLAEAGIAVCQGYDPADLCPHPDQVIIGNAMSRGNACVEYVLDAGLAYVSGPQWLAENVLAGRHVIAVAGTHGKTTTTSMIAHALTHSGRRPGFLIGGIAQDLGVSAALGDADEVFVVEADEYDTAFFDKRSKFVHYRPRTLVLNNLEFDHADIFDDLAAIQRQVHHLIRTVPAAGQLVVNGAEPALADVLAQGCWTPVTEFNSASGWHSQQASADGQHWTLVRGAQTLGELEWRQRGAHNIANACAALAALDAVGVAPGEGLAALSVFRGVKRRLELRGTPGGIAVFDDFAHHPTAIAATLDGLAGATAGRLVAVFEPRSNTMRAGVHAATLAASFASADRVFVYADGLDWLPETVFAEHKTGVASATDIETLIDDIAAVVQAGDTIVIMSNGGFGGIHERLIARLERVS